MSTTISQSSLTTYDDYRHLPDDGKQYQIIGGELYMTPAPTPYHQEVSLTIAAALRKFVKEYHLGKVYAAPIDVVLSMTDIVQPDLVFVARERLNIITKKNIVEAPDLVIDILSEHTESIDRTKKMALYEKHGVKEYWIVNPDDKSIDLFVLKENVLILKTTVSGTQNLSSHVLNGFTLTANNVFNIEPQNTEL